MEEREHEQQTNEHDVLTVIRVPRSTILASWSTKFGASDNQHFTCSRVKHVLCHVIRSRMFHGLSPLEFHGVIVIGLGFRFEVREAHAPTS